MNSLLIMLLSNTVVAKTLSFNEAMTTISRASLDVRHADEALTSRRDLDDLISYNALPTVDATATAGRSAYVGVNNTTTSRRTVGVSANLNLYQGGATIAARDAAAAARREAEHTRDDVIAQVEARAALSLIEVIERLQELDIAQRSLAATSENVSLARKLYDRGLRPAQDVAKVEIDAANEAAKVRDASLRLQAAQAALTTLAGTPLAVEAVWPWSARLRRAAQGLQKPVFSSKARADRLALVDRLDKLEADTIAARATARPRLDFELGYDVVEFLPKPTFSDAITQQWRGKLALTVPLFSGFTAEQATKILFIDKARTSYELAVLDRNAAEDLETARAAVAGSAAATDERDQTVSKARQLFERSLKSFREGVLNANELAQDQERLLAAELNALHSWAAAHRDFVKLCRALGERLDQCGQAN